MSDYDNGYDEGYRAGMQKMREVSQARIKELEERLKAVTDDAKEAEAYAGEMEAVLERIKAKLATCEKYRDAYDKMGRIGTEAYRDLEAKLEKAVEALDGVMVGGNHLAVWLSDDHPPAEVEPLAALEKIGAGVSFDVWCCWRSIMLARTTLAELKGEDRG